MDAAIKHECHVLHGDIPQAKRESTLAAFEKKSFRVLVATDVAARGLDLDVEVTIILWCVLPLLLGLQYT